jgi:excisionase family DNA binding protein
MNLEKQKVLTSKSYLSTGDAATLCSVTPDTVLKWIRAGKIKALRTPGGHHRIPRQALAPLIEKHYPELSVADNRGPFLYCWEFNSESGVIPEDCRKCIVYRSRTRRCYEMESLPTEVGHARRFCKGTCDECEYFKMVQGQHPNLLVVTDQKVLRAMLETERETTNFNLRITDCEYRCSMSIEKFRPDYVVIDCAMGAERSREFVNLLYEDPRIPFVRIILVGNRSDLPKECDKRVFASLEHGFSVSTLTDLIAGTSSQFTN